MKYITSLVFLFIILAGLVSCGQDAEYENYGMQVSGDLGLTQNNHTHGWTRTDCFSCHVRANIHRINYLGTAYENMLATARRSTQYEGLGGCNTCHGLNGVE